MSARLTGGATPGWRPLPECPICGEPVRRAVFDRNGGTCTACRGVVADLAPPAADVVDLIEWQALVSTRATEERLRAAEKARKRAERRG